LENEDWQDYGHVNTSTGDWLFDREKINEKIEEEIEKVRYCPLFDAEKTRSVIKKIPEKINPKTDKNWAYISNDYEKWFWHENKWLSTTGETNFPGFNPMVYIEKISKKEINEAIQLSKWDDSTKISYRKSSRKAKQKSGCFIATAVYGDSQVYQVKMLRCFRDRYLEKRILGKLFVDAYYKVSPSIVEFISKKQTLRDLIRRTLDVIVKIIEMVI
jgi:hypothetical protein